LRTGRPPKCLGQWPRWIAVASYVVCCTLLYYCVVFQIVWEFGPASRGCSLSLSLSLSLSEKTLLLQLLRTLVCVCVCVCYNNNNNNNNNNVYLAYSAAVGWGCRRSPFCILYIIVVSVAFAAVRARIASEVYMCMYNIIQYGCTHVLRSCYITYRYIIIHIYRVVILSGHGGPTTAVTVHSMYTHIEGLCVCVCVCVCTKAFRSGRVGKLTYIIA